jgi:alcohol dehydrogenase (cytochrome c)
MINVRWSFPLALAVTTVIVAAAQQPLVRSVYSGQQATSGSAAYSRNCATCHRPDLTGSTDAPPLAGAEFMTSWRTRTVQDLLTYVQSSMPPTSPGSLGADTYQDIAAFILQRNGAAAGTEPLTAATVAQIGTVASGAVSAPASAQAAAPAGRAAGPAGRPAGSSAVGNRRVANFTPVTDAMLVRPDPSEWLNWRRTLDGWGYSPLNQINTQNAQRLQLVWSWGLPAGDSQPTPLVHDGVMYIPGPLGVVQALDATTGEFIWEYRKQFESERNFLTMMRNIAIYGDKVFVATHDAHIVALNARNGAVVWDRTVADYKLGYRYTSGPIVVKGRIVAGMTGCDVYKNDVCFISAHDPETGKEIWRTSTIARPGDPGGDTWGNLPLTFRAGGDAWMPGSYDPQLDLIYWSTAQAKPWARFQRGDEGNELYTNSTLAINPDTGRIIWHHQFIPGDSHDQDEVYESILIDHDGRSSLYKMGKLGILWELDRKTGQFISGHDLGYQTIFEMNPTDGKLTYMPNMLQKLGVEVDYCPTIHGVKNWRAMAYHPDTKAFYIPLFPSCEAATYTEVERKEGGGGNGRIGGSKPHFHPVSPDQTGQFVAMDMKTGGILWRHPTQLPMASAALTTGGGLAIVGGVDRNLYVHDAKTGKVLFQTRLPTAVQGFPITYAVRGRQYIAVPVGTGPASWIGVSARITQTKAPPAMNAIFVFALPES